jgi:23S rRNA G2445 N2-methylase RlmL
MCGGGTLAIEAAAWSRNMAPGLARARFGLERWANHDDDMRSRMRDLRERARASVRPPSVEIVAADVDPDAVAAARDNARAAGVEIDVRQGDATKLERQPPGTTVVSNPPYGERLDASFELYDELAAALRRAACERVALLAGTPAIPRAMGRPADRFWILFNGPIECRLLVYTSLGV